jgi:hypothetical protein
MMRDGFLPAQDVAPACTKNKHQQQWASWPRAAEAGRAAVDPVTSAPAAIFPAAAPGAGLRPCNPASFYSHRVLTSFDATPCAALYRATPANRAAHFPQKETP